ncbi:MAG: hypothetical protein H0V01_10200 [Bacteroidetes bacterium]|nr:hypothetical protein [Bacteroidota bacterium]HET6246032.1 hypothetical protein [Bacteroidia bacterium]
MRNRILLHVSIALLSFALVSNSAWAQCDTIATLCSKHLGGKFISDGQSYRSLLLEKEVAEFHATLFGGTTYRFSACSGLTDGNLIFSVYDKQRNLLFKNSDYKTSSYWDFKINSTIECIIEAELVSGNTSGCAVLLIGFKQ